MEGTSAARFGTGTRRATVQSSFICWLSIGRASSLCVDSMSLEMSLRELSLGRRCVLPCVVGPRWAFKGWILAPRVVLAPALRSHASWEIALTAERHRCRGIVTTQIGSEDLPGPGQSSNKLGTYGAAPRRPPGPCHLRINTVSGNRTTRLLEFSSISRRSRSLFWNSQSEQAAGSGLGVGVMGPVQADATATPEGRL